MKNRILTFLIGLLVGAIIVMTIFYGYLKSINKQSNQFEESRFGMNMPDGQNQNGGMHPQFGEFNGENPPEKPSGENGFNGNRI